MVTIPQAQWHQRRRLALSVPPWEEVCCKTSRQDKKNFGTQTLGQSEVFEASLFELQLDREPLNDIQIRSWNPMVEEAKICEGRHNCHKGIAVS
jgi:hypothetical protein